MLMHTPSKTRWQTFKEGLARKIYERLTGKALGDYGAEVDADLQGFRRLSSAKTTRDLTPLSQEQALRVAHYLHTSNGLAKFLIKCRVDVILGTDLDYAVEIDRRALGGASGEASEDRAREVVAEIRAQLDPWWGHPQHNLRARAREYFTTYLVTGELALPIAARNEVTGLPLLDYVDSEGIHEVSPFPDTSMVPDKVWVKQATTEPKPFQIVRLNPQTESYEGECFYFRHADILNAMRGRPDLLDVADWVDAIDQYLWTRADRGKLVNAQVFDVTMEDATETQCTAYANMIRAVLGTPGGVFVHNNKVKLEVRTPQMHGADAAAEAQMLLIHVLGAKGIPLSWFAHGGDTNRATSGEQTDVAYKALEALRADAVGIFDTIVAFGYDQLAARQNLPQRGKGVTIRAALGQVAERDVTRHAATAGPLAAALEAAVDAKHLSRKTSRRVWVAICEKLGVQTTLDEEQKLIEEEKAELDQEAEERQARAAAAGLAPKLGPMPPGGEEDEPDEPPVREGLQPSVHLEPHFNVSMPTMEPHITTPPVTLNVQPTPVPAVHVHTEAKAPDVVVVNQMPGAKPGDVIVVNQVPPAAPAPVTVENTVNVDVPPPGPLEVERDPRTGRITGIVPKE